MGPAADFGELFRDEVDALYRLALRMLGDADEAEDAVQDAFLRLTRRRDRPSEFRSARAWAFRAVRTVCLDRLRRRARRADFAIVAFDEERHGAPGATPEGAALEAELFDRLDRALAGMPAAEAETVTLVAVEGLSYAEVAEAMEVPIGTVRSRLHRARSALRAALPDAQGRPEPEGRSTVVRFSRKNP